jgi:hypothetical protein
MRAMLIAVVVAAASLVALPTAAATTAPPRTSLHVVSLASFTIGGRHFLGRTPAQVTAAFGRPSARISSGSGLRLRFGAWTIRFERRTSDGRLIAASAVTTDQALFGTSGRRLLAPWFGPRGIEGAVTREVEWVPDGDWNEWIPRAGGYDGPDFPRRITWGVDSRGLRWLRLATDLEVEFRS